MKMRALLYLVVFAMLLLPAFTLFNMDAFGYGSGGGGGGAAVSLFAPPVTTVLPTTTVTPPATTVNPPAATTSVALTQMTSEATAVAGGAVSALTSTPNATLEAKYETTIVNKITSGATETQKDVITNFVTYGTSSTQILGAGERGGVVNSYKAAFGVLPTTSAQWNDVIKIANGRWPSVTSATAETKATTAFKKIYLRDPNRVNAKDDAAVTVIAYGLRPANRNLNSEKAAIKSFKAIYGTNPTTATNWDVVRAIAYSGATR